MNTHAKLISNLKNTIKNLKKINQILISENAELKLQNKNICVSCEHGEERLLPTNILSHTDRKLLNNIEF